MYSELPSFIIAILSRLKYCIIMRNVLLFRNELMQGIESGVNMILNYFNTDNRLQKVLLIHKGRQMFIRSLAVANEGGQLQLMQAFFAAVNYAAKKVPSDEASNLRVFVRPFDIDFFI